MFWEVARWSCIAVPAAGLLIAFAVAGFAALGSAYSTFQTSSVGESLGFLLWQTLGSIVVWVALTTRWRALRRRLALEAVLFPLDVALVGGVAAALWGGAAWPSSTDVFAISVIGWLGFSWTLLAARSVAERLFSPEP